MVHAQEGFFALNAVCTHLGCLTAWKPDLGIIACPCHGSKFAMFSPRQKPGKNRWPRAQAAALAQDVAERRGELMVDRSETFARDSS